MVSTSVAATPACGAAACNDTRAQLGGIRHVGTWALISDSVGGAVAGAQRRSAAAAGLASAVAAGHGEKLKSSSVAVGAVDFACGAHPRAATAVPTDCELLLPRRVQRFGGVEGLSNCPAVPPHTDAAASGAAGTGGTGGDAVETTQVFDRLASRQRLCAGESGALSCRNGRFLVSSTTEEEDDYYRAGLGSNRLSPAVVMGTSCPDFLLFFSRSPKGSHTGAEDTDTTLLVAPAAEPANGFDSNTCGSACSSACSSACGSSCSSACVSTDDEKASGCSRQEHDLCSKHHRLARASVVSIPEARPAAALAARSGGVSTTAIAGGVGEEETATATHGVRSVRVLTAEIPTATLAAPTGETPCAAELVEACAPVLPAAQPLLADAAEQMCCRVSAAEPQSVGRYTDATRNGDTYTVQEDGLGRQATLEAFAQSSGCTAQAAAEEAAVPAAGSPITGDVAEPTEKAASEKTEALAANEGVGPRPARDAATKGERSGHELRGAVPEMENNCGDAGACSRVDAAVLFPLPQAPSLPQLLQLPDVYDAAILALRVLPERYMERVRQLDALEVLCPCVYVQCSYLARVRHIYVVSAELTLSKQQTLLEQLLQERSSGQRSRMGGAQPLAQQQDEEGESRSEGEEQMEEEEEEENSSCSWNGNREKHKALHAVAELLMKVKAVQMRVGPALLAGAAQLADALQALEQLQQKRTQNTDGCNCSTDMFHHSGPSSTSGTFSRSNADMNSGVNSEAVRSMDMTDLRNVSDRDSASSSQDTRNAPVGCAGTICFGDYCNNGVQTLVDNFLHSFLSCRVAAELQREHFLLAVQSGDCGAILSSCLPMENLIFQAALDAQELALHHLGIAAPVEVWVGEAGEADQQLRNFLLAASLHEGPVTVAWSACSSPRSDTRASKLEETGCAGYGLTAGMGVAAADEGACARDGTTGSTLTRCADHRAQRQRQQEGCKGGRTGGSAEGRTDTVAGGGGSTPCCNGCFGSSFVATSASPRWSNRGGGDMHNTYAFSSSNSRGMTGSALPGTVRFPCFASYAYSGVFELLKNSMRASVEAWRLNRFTRNSSSSNGSGRSNGSEGRSSSSSDGASQRSSRSESDKEEQQKWRLVSVKRSRKLKKLPGRVRLQRCCFESAPARLWGMMACSEDLAAAADDERAARSRSRDNTQPSGHGQSRRDVAEQADFPAREAEEELCCQVFQLEDGVLEPIKVLLLFIDESLIIRIEDRGEGLRQNELQNVWSFAYTTAAGKGLLQRLAAASEDGEHEKEESGASETTNAGRGTSCSSAATPVPPLAGCGVGLPMSRVHAQSLGGDIFLESAEGIGTCAYMCLSNLQGFRDRFYEQRRSRQQRNM